MNASEKIANGSASIRNQPQNRPRLNREKETEKRGMGELVTPPHTFRRFPGSPIHCFSFQDPAIRNFWSHGTGLRSLVSSPSCTWNSELPTIFDADAFC